MRKKNNNAKWNRVMALLLSGVMVLGSAPVGALAAEPDVAEVQVEDAESEEIVVGQEPEDTKDETTPVASETPTPTETPTSTILVKSMKFADIKYENGREYFWLGEEVELPELIVEPQNATEKIEYTVEPTKAASIKEKDGKKVLVINRNADVNKITIKATAENSKIFETIEISVKAPIEAKNLDLIEGTEGKIEVDNIINGTKEGYCVLENGEPEGIIGLEDDGRVVAKNAGTVKVKVKINQFNSVDYTVCTVTVKHDCAAEWIKEKEAQMKCKYCGETVPVKIKEDDKALPSSCTEPEGYQVSATFSDGKEYFARLPIRIDAKPTGHSLKVVPKQEATCKAEGNLSYYLCENCGGHFKGADGKEAYEEKAWVIPKAEHMKDAGNPTKKATATKEGVRTYICKVCKEEVEKCKIPRTAFTYKLGTKSGCIVSKVSDFKSIQLPTSSAYSTTKKAFTLDTKTWTLSPTQNASKYYKSMKTSIPLMITTKDGKTSKVTVNFQFPDPEVKITRTYETQAGKGVYRYTFDYNIPGATRIYVRLNTKNTRINNDFVSDFKKYISKPKSDKESYIRVWKSYVDSVGKKGMKFQITAYYGNNNKSRTITIAK